MEITSGIGAQGNLARILVTFRGNPSRFVDRCAPPPTFALSLAFGSLPHPKGGGQMGGPGGRLQRSRLPPGLHSENRFMVKGALKAPGPT